MKTFSPSRNRSGVALLITLLILSLITIIAVAFLGTMSWEISDSRRNYETQKARSLAMLGMNTAVAQLRLALGTWDNPYANFTNSAPAYYWSVSPGLLTRWAYNSVAPQTVYPLFSQGTTNLVNLNAVAGDGSYPIAGGPTPPSISVYWANVLKDPTSASGANNPIIGRYAFWVDDDTSKINVNTADGTMKYQTNSLGLGTPTEVSLQELQSGGAPITKQTATNIVYIARTTGFNSPREILRAPGTTLDVYTNNVFNLTTSSRSPDLNIFGQPKMPLVAITEQNNIFTAGATQGQYNCATLLPPREFYPGQQQLPTFTFVDSFFNTTGDAANTFVSANHINATWPQAVCLNESDSYAFNSFYATDYSPWANGLVIANYLAGKNVSGQAITWPAMSGTSGSSFLGKYTNHQLDSMAMQVTDFVTAASPDWGINAPNNATSTRGTPHVWRGWLSGQLVTGASRFPKFDKVLMEFSTKGSSGTLGSTNYSAPRVSTVLYVEAWLPSRYQGSSLIRNTTGSGTIHFGPSTQGSTINGQDFETTTGGTTVTDSKGGVNTINSGSPLPKIPANNGPNPPDLTTNSVSYWGNNLLQTDQGVDWEGNNPNYPDPDPVMAQAYHPYALETVSTNTYFGSYKGTGQGLSRGVNPVFAMNALEPSSLTSHDWYPGEYRCVSNGSRAAYPMEMKPSAAGGTLNISGGIALDLFNGTRTSDAEIAPLESKRGGKFLNTFVTPPGTVGTEGLSGESYQNATVYSRTLQSVIPINVSIPVPADNTELQNMWVYAYAPDPLVNKYPGDWKTNTPSATPPATTMQYATANTVQLPGTAYAEYSESAATIATMTDPDSYWMPTIDNYATQPYSSDPPTIPRSARFPSVGYLQYVRTGIVPDDETVPYNTQAGTPFRLVNFSPSTSTTQAITRGGTTSASYPDWAMLDLFYSPSSLLGYGSPYEPLAGPVYSSLVPISPSTATPTLVNYSNTNVVNNMLAYGTYGGATSGRINPNGSVIYTTNTTIPTPNITRTVPLQALLHNLVVNRTQISPYTNTITSVDFTGPQMDSGTAVDESAVASAIASYLASNGPLRMPGEICNIPAVAGYVAPNNATRNDLVRQIIGNLTTQSNSYSIWVTGQSITKTKGNTDYGNFESTDQITGTVRYHFLVERYLDAGVDGVYGNSIGAGLDGNVGTLDDAVNASTHPLSPRYLYRVVYAEEIR